MTRQSITQLEGATPPRWGQVVSICNKKKKEKKKRRDLDSLEKQQININKYGRSYLSSFYLYTNLIDNLNKLGKHNNNQRKPKKINNNTKQNKTPNFYTENPPRKKLWSSKIFHCQIMSLQQYSLLGKTRRDYGNISTQFIFFSSFYKFNRHFANTIIINRYRKIQQHKIR